MNIEALLLTLLVGLFVFVGTLIGMYSRNNKKFIDVTIGMAFGIILALIVLELLPESIMNLCKELGMVRGIISFILLTILGICTLKVIDLFIPNHNHDEHSKNEELSDLHLHHIGIVLAATLIVHNLIEGMSLYIGITESNAYAMAIGIALHNIPLGLVIVSTLNHHNYPKKKTAIISLLVSLSTFVGGIIMFISKGSENTLASAILLSITLGMLIYIAVFELFSQIRHMKDKRSAWAGICLGVLILIISTFLE